MDDIAILRQKLRYDSVTGKFYWRRGRQVGRELFTPVRGKGYLEIRIVLRAGEGRRYFRAHRVAFALMTGMWPGDQTDHKNRDKTDNRWENLRQANNSQNNVNRTIQRNNTSGFKGVDFHKADGRWRARIKIDGRRIHIGNFDTPEAASAAHDTWQYLHFGEFCVSS